MYCLPFRFLTFLVTSFDEAGFYKSSLFTNIRINFIT
jgi:hypothetical protein